MKKIDKILVPTDFSEHSKNAAEVGAHLAKKYGAELYIMHSVDIPVYEENHRFTSYQDIPEGIFFMKLAKKRFNEFLDNSFFEGVRVVEVLQMQNTINAIINQAEEHGIDLIVMGSKGASGIRELFVGSTTERIIRSAKCPVLTIKDRHKDFDIENIIFASEFDEKAQHSFSNAMEYTKVFDAKYHLLKVVTPKNFEPSTETIKAIRKFADKFDMNDYDIEVYNDHSVEEGVLNYMSENKGGLLVMPTHARKGISHLIFGSITEDVTNHANFPVLSIEIPD